MPTLISKVSQNRSSDSSAFTGCGGVGPPGRHVDRAGRPGAGGRVLQEGHRRRAGQHALPPLALLFIGTGE